jgi:hypothetical protein
MLKRLSSGKGWIVHFAILFKVFPTTIAFERDVKQNPDEDSVNEVRDLVPQ